MNLKTRLFGRNYLVRELIDGKEKELPFDVYIPYYYSWIETCGNCNHLVNVYIKKGIYVKDVFSEIVCDNCGCKLTKGDKK